MPGTRTVASSGPEPLRQAQPGLLRALLPLCAAMFLGFMTVSLPLPVLPLHVYADLGLGTVLAGFTVGLQSFATIVTRPVAGRMVDRAGAKPTLIRGLVISAAAGFAYLASVPLAFSPPLSLAVLLAGRLVLGMGESLMITGLLGWALARAGPGRTGLAMSWNGMAQYAALAAGAPLGLLLYGAFGFASVSVAVALLPLLALAVVLPLQPAPALGGARLPLMSVIKLIRRPGLALMLAGIAFAAISTFASLDFLAHGWRGAGFALTAFGAAFILVRLVAGGLPDRIGGSKAAALSMAVACAGQAMLWAAPNAALAIAGAAVTGLGCSLVYPSLGVEAVRRVPLESRGIAIGAFTAFQDLAIGLTGPVLGGLAAVAGPSWVFSAGAVAAALGAVVSLSIGRSAATP